MMELTAPEARAFVDVTDYLRGNPAAVRAMLQDAKADTRRVVMATNPSGGTRPQDGSGGGKGKPGGQGGNKNPKPCPSGGPGFGKGGGGGKGKGR